MPGRNAWDRWPAWRGACKSTGWRWEDAPDGAGKEGVTYWNFASRYNILLLASLQSALGTDFGLTTVDGLQQSGDYQIAMCGAGRMSVDFSDCTLVPLSEPQHFWMGKRYSIPRYSWFRYNALRDGQQGGLLDLL
ncbi:MAG: hypothetical protein K9N23_17430 [Akkermansiaceae bacterium]|nr:hypothetical protein [Akkermansiaceae bacterium]MCF7733476.1 hypothetical protein [Akkermansiaceae bacterium]